MEGGDFVEELRDHNPIWKEIYEENVTTRRYPLEVIRGTQIIRGLIQYLNIYLSHSIKCSAKFEVINNKVNKGTLL